MRIAVLGGGISGLSLVRILRDEYGIEADLYEKEQTPGGLCRTRLVDGYVFDISGGHVYNSKHDRVNRFVFGLQPPDRWVKSARNAKILFNGKIIDYPFEYALHQLDHETAANCILDLASAAEVQCNNLDEFFVSKFGKSIVDLYLRPYNEKIWKCSARELAYDWVAGKIPQPSCRDILLHLLDRSSNEQVMTHSSYYYPKYGGIQTLIDRLADGLPRAHIGVAVESIEFRNNSTLVNGTKYDLVVSTLSLTALPAIIRALPDRVRTAVCGLRSNGVLSLLYSKERDDDYSWVYIPDNDFIPNRMVCQGNFSIDCCPEGKSSVVFEVTRPESFDIGNVRSQIEHRYPSYEYVDHNITEQAYVVFDLERESNLTVVKEYFSDKRFLLHGRFARWEYPNMDVCIHESFELAGQIACSAGVNGVDGH